MLSREINTVIINILIAFRALNRELPGWSFRFVFVIVSHQTGCFYPKFGLALSTWREGTMVSWPGGPAGHAPPPLHPPESGLRQHYGCVGGCSGGLPSETHVPRASLPPAAGQKGWGSSRGRWPPLVLHPPGRERCCAGTC